MEVQKMEKWGTKLTIKFLKKYREHRCLWDFNDPDYKNRVARTKALQDIVACMALNNFDVRSANVKIKALRSTYLHEKRKIRKSSKTGVSYRPKLAWYPLADSFLRNYVMEKFCLMGAVPTEDETVQRLQHKDPTTSNANENCTVINLIDGQQSVNSSTLQKLPTNASNQQSIKRTQQSFTPSQHNIAPSILQNNKKDKNVTSNQIHTTISNLGDIIENCRSNSHNNNLSHHKDNDEFDAFANSIAAQMRILPLDVAYEVQLQIQCLITQTKLKVLGRQTSIIVESNNSSSSSSRNWNQSNHNSNNENFSNACNNEVKVEEDDSETTVNNVTQNNQNANVSNTNCYNMQDNLQDPEGSDVEDYLGLE